MPSENTHPSTSRETTDTDRFSQQLDAVGWALFLIWVGIAFLADLGWGWGLLGVGIIILGETVVRWVWHLGIGPFWIFCCLAFLVGGLWELFAVPWPLVPILLILCGVAVLWGIVSGKHVMKK